MRWLIVAVVLLVGFGGATAEAGHVNGYYRRNGTYVQGYERSDPDGDRSNNYGRRGSDQPSYISPQNYDYDHDGIPNRYDLDDNNNGILDNNERR